MQPAVRTAVWLNEDQVPLAMEVAGRAGLELVIAGSPDRGRSAAVAESLRAEAHDDVRTLLLEADVELVWFLSAKGLDDDTAALIAAGERGVRLASLEPIPASAIAIAHPRWQKAIGGASACDLVRLCPFDRFSRAARDGADLLDLFGSASVLSIDATCAPCEGTLGSRLLSAIDQVHALLGEPEAVNAVYTHPASDNPIVASPGDDLLNLHGSISAAVRLADGRGATILVSDQSHDWYRDITLIGPKGRLSISDSGVRWSGDKEPHTPSQPLGSRPTDAAEAISWSLRRLLDPGLPAERPSDIASLLATAQTALLSARTGQAETVATVRRMAGVG